MRLGSGRTRSRSVDVFDDEMLTIEDVAAYLKLKPQTIYKWAQTGKIPGAKFGKEWRFRRSAIERWIDRQISSQTRGSSGDGSSGDGSAVVQGEGADSSGRPKRAGLESEKLKARTSNQGKAPRVSKDGRGPDKN